jgi:hypothetical protein
MQTPRFSINGQPVRGAERRGLRILLAAARRSKSVLLATAVVALCAGCASLPGASGTSGTSGTSGSSANSCTGPVSYCNIFFGS